MTVRASHVPQPTPKPQLLCGCGNHRVKNTLSLKVHREPAALLCSASMLGWPNLKALMYTSPVLGTALFVSLLGKVNALNTRS